MSVIVIHSLDDRIERIIRERAKATGTSVEEVVKAAEETIKEPLEA